MLSRASSKNDSDHSSEKLDAAALPESHPDVARASTTMSESTSVTSGLVRKRQLEPTQDDILIVGEIAGERKPLPSKDVDDAFADVASHLNPEPVFQRVNTVLGGGGDHGGGIAQQVKNA